MFYLVRLAQTSSDQRETDFDTCYSVQRNASTLDCNKFVFYIASDSLRGSSSAPALPDLI